MTIYVLNDPLEAEAFGTKTYTVDGDDVEGTSFVQNASGREEHIVAEGNDVSLKTANMYPAHAI